MIPPFGIGDPGPLAGTGLADPMELVRKTWASFALPPSMAPTMDPDEIARRVAELKTIEQWLVMNLTMLRSTIQALEIQQSTLVALRAFGMPGTGGPAADNTPPADAPEQGSAPAPEAAASSAPMPDALNPIAWWDLLQKQFGEVAAAALAGLPPAGEAGKAPGKSRRRSPAGVGQAAAKAGTGKPARKTRAKAATPRTRTPRG